MKKILLPSLAAFALLATSCVDDHGYEENTVNIQVKSPAVVIPSSSTEEAYFINDYSIRYTQYTKDSKMSLVGLTPLTLPNGTTFNFSSPATSVSGNQFTFIIEPLSFTTENDITVQLRSRLTMQYYSYNPGTASTSVLNNAPIALTVVKIGNSYTLKTLQNVMSFAGTTTSLINGSNPYENPNVLYELTPDYTNRKAQIIIYNSKFAEAMPAIRVMRLTGLSFVPSASTGYVVSGENIVPEVLEGNNWIPNEKFVFNNFSLQPTNDNLSMASISFKVATSFTGTCQGSYIVQ